MKLQGARRGGRNGNRDASLHRHGPVDEIDRAASRTAGARGLATDGRTRILRVYGPVLVNCTSVDRPTSSLILLMMMDEERQ